MIKKIRKDIKNTIRNNLQNHILFDMYEKTLYEKNLTCEEVGDMYISVMKELVDEYINDKHLYFDYVNRN